MYSRNKEMLNIRFVNVKPEKTSKMKSSPFDNVTTSRAAGVIQLQHKKDPTFEVNHARQARMDEKIHVHPGDILNYSKKDPLQLVEDLLASTGRIGRTYS
jgi:hypothetical protein